MSSVRSRNSSSLILYLLTPVIAVGRPDTWLVNALLLLRDLATMENVSTVGRKGRQSHSFFP